MKILNHFMSFESLGTHIDFAAALHKGIKNFVLRGGDAFNIKAVKSIDYQTLKRDIRFFQHVVFHTHLTYRTEEIYSLVDI